MESTNEKNWHVDTGESVFETDVETLTQWIWEGAVLPHHRVSREGTRWLEAGKVPKFAEHFATAREMNDLLGADTPLNNTPLPPARAALPHREDRFATPSEIAAAAPTPFGLRLMVGSAVALVLALLGGYLWAYHISSPREFAALKNEPKIVELQTKLDKDKAVTELFRNSKPAEVEDWSEAARSGQGLGPAKTGEMAVRTRLAGQLDIPTYNPPPMRKMVDVLPPRDYDGEIKNLEAQFETDKNKIVAEIRAADSKARMLPATAILFVGLFGLNFVRLKFSSKK